MIAADSILVIFHFEVIYVTPETWQEFWLYKQRNCGEKSQSTVFIYYEKNPNIWCKNVVEKTWKVIRGIITSSKSIFMFLINEISDTDVVYDMGKNHNALMLRVYDC